MGVFEDFFRELDAAWGARSEERVRLRIIGSAALMLQTDYVRGTKDSDVLETADLTSEIKGKLLTLGGKGSRLFERHRMYLEIVAPGIPFLPQGALWHPLDGLNGALQSFEIAALDVVDVVVSKLKRAHAADMDDVAEMVDRGLVPHARLIERFRSAVDVFTHDARASDLPRYIAALHRVERDFFAASPTEIDLPDWL